MPIHVKAAGVWKEVKDVFIKSGGVWTPVEYVRTKIAGVWTVVHQAEIVVVVTAAQTGLILSSLFTTEDWASTKKKRVVIQAGVVIGGVAWGAIAIQGGGNAAGATWGGELRLDNYGEIRGIGGAPNGGVGGSALYEDTVNFAKKCILRNYGAIRAGGGGGGRGGNGGTGGRGYYTTGSTQGPYYNASYYWITLSGGGIGWAGSKVYSGNPPGTSIAIGGYTYYRGAFQGGYEYAVSRSNLQTHYTNGGAGGAGGNGGRGMGSDGANTGGAAGANGAAGGTNAGAGGKGGTGGTGGGWGAAGAGGATGATGNSGNYTGGSAGAGGAGGGAAGIAYRAALWQIEVAGTIQGRVV